MTPELFEQQMRQQGYEIATVERPAHGSLDLHTHPFEARALILEGEITIVAEGKTQFCRAGSCSSWTRMFRTPRPMVRRV